MNDYSLAGMMSAKVAFVTNNHDLLRDALGACRPRIGCTESVSDEQVEAIYSLVYEQVAAPGARDLKSAVAATGIDPEALAAKVTAAVPGLVARPFNGEFRNGFTLRAAE